ncbi:metallophosphoesterase family protein [Muricoccus pecuniae]|uniref:Diadenosine tetraphosphatase ApaH/serine/threonine PP2A family protein phosphatase n=1 Tax=Muricoccus pecuniae TaxID=693023 RepID=A0A840YGE9_9PROT|nr:metallophosphoesterase family protein [Roseomonas pecuniae]MBB5692944.1 diadenosine tetraphosphatase ApaH/serine/threonine PP2A family protein phosphatase [Roseomonas pecuniae]
MLIALLADVHANREALEACLEHAREAGAERLVFLGDLVGYGADPEWVVETVMAEVARGAVAVRGNHDDAVRKGPGGMNGMAAAAIDWTRERLSPEAAGFLARLPLDWEEEGRLYVHADASDPEAWHYVTDADAALASLNATDAWATFCGHTHVPRLFGITAAVKLTGFRPVPGVAVPLLRARKWVAVLGAVGQPRDGDPSACYGMLDTERSELTWHRVPYDAAAAAEKIREAGLPEVLALRLLRGA